MHIEQGDVLDIIIHPNPNKYPGQQVLILNINGYAYAVPFVEQGEDRYPEPKTYETISQVIYAKILSRR